MVNGVATRHIFLIISAWWQGFPPAYAAGSLIYKKKYMIVCGPNKSLWPIWARNNCVSLARRLKKASGLVLIVEAWLNNIMINIFIEDIFYHTSTVIPEM